MSRLQKEQLIKELTEIRTDLNALKAAQRVGGDSLQGYLTHGYGPNDYSFPVGPNGEVHYVLSFIPATPAQESVASGSIVDLFAFYTIDDPNVTANAYPPWASGPPVSMLIQPLPPSGLNQQWYLAFGNYGSSSWTVYLKFIFSGTTGGSWSMNLVP